MKTQLLVIIFAVLLTTACNDMQQAKPAIQKIAQFTTTAVLLSGKAASGFSEVFRW